MATHGDLTAGKLIKYLQGFPKDTKIVMGKDGMREVHLNCHANTYYPDYGNEETDDFRLWVVIDPTDSETYTSEKKNEDNS